MHSLYIYITGNARLLRKIFQNHNRLSQSRLSGVKRSRCYNCLMDCKQNPTLSPIKTQTKSNDTQTSPTQTTASAGVVDPVVIIANNIGRGTSGEVKEASSFELNNVSGKYSGHQSNNDNLRGEVRSLFDFL